MGLTHVTVKLKSLAGQTVRTKRTFWLTPAQLTRWRQRQSYAKPAFNRLATAYERADGRLEEYEFGLAEITFMGEVTAGRIIFGPDNVEPLLGVTALESIGVTIDPRRER